MKKVILNGSFMDMDKSTIIGFDYQTYDIKEPARPKVTISNKVSFPATARNLNIIGYANNPQVDSDVPFDEMFCTYIEGNDVVVENAKVRIESVGTRIDLVIFDKNNVWDLFKQLLIPDINVALLVYLAEKYDLPITTNKATTYSSFLDAFINRQTGIILPFYFSNLYEKKLNEADTTYMEGLNFITLANGDMQGGHFCICVKDFFQFLEDQYDIDFQTDVDFDYNIFKDEYAGQVFVPWQGFTVKTDGGYYLSIKGTETFDPLDNVSIKNDKTINDLIEAYFKHFNILIDNFWLDGKYENRCYRFDAIFNAPVENWTGKLSGKQTYQPTLQGINQNNWLRFSGVYEGGSKNFNAKNIICANKNIDVDGELITIEAYLPNGAKSLAGNFIPNMSVSDAFTSFTFFVFSGLKENCVVWLGAENIEVLLQIPALYDLTSEYNLYQEMIRKPKVYTAEKWMTLSDIRNIRFFKQYYIQELGGCYFLNKIKGYVAGSLRSTTQIELIKISNNTPYYLPNSDNYIDGNRNDFVDGAGNFFY